MRTSIGSWGRCQWIKERGHVLIHPADRDAFVDLFPHCNVFQYVADEGDYMVLRCGARSYRVRPRFFEPVPAPEFDVGETVRFVKGGEWTEGVIQGIYWHFKEAKLFYFVVQGGKKLKKRYWASDFT